MSIEETTDLKPQFDKDGLIPCITVCVKTKDVLMMAWMNEQALNKTLETGEAHYWSRSRQELWHKGATSSAIQKVVSVKIDCDQDCLLMTVEVRGDQKSTCHTGRKSCFYREIEIGSKVKSLKFLNP